MQECKKYHGRPPYDGLFSLKKRQSWPWTEHFTIVREWLLFIVLIKDQKLQKNRNMLILKNNLIVFKMYLILLVYMQLGI